MGGGCCGTLDRTVAARLTRGPSSSQEARRLTEEAGVVRRRAQTHYLLLEFEEAVCQCTQPDADDRQAAYQAAYQDALDDAERIHNDTYAHYSAVKDGMLALSALETAKRRAAANCMKAMESGADALRLGPCRQRDAIKKMRETCVRGDSTANRLRAATRVKTDDIDTVPADTVYAAHAADAVPDDTDTLSILLAADIAATEEGDIVNMSAATITEAENVVAKLGELIQTAQKCCDLLTTQRTQRTLDETRKRTLDERKKRRASYSEKAAATGRRAMTVMSPPSSIGSQQKPAVSLSAIMDEQERDENQDYERPLKKARRSPRLPAHSAGRYADSPGLPAASCSGTDKRRRSDDRNLRGKSEGRDRKGQIAKFKKRKNKRKGK